MKRKIIFNNIFCTTCGILFLVCTLIFIIYHVFFITSDSDLANSIRTIICICEGSLLSILIHNISSDIEVHKLIEEEGDYNERKEK